MLYIGRKVALLILQTLIRSYGFIIKTFGYTIRRCSFTIRSFGYSLLYGKGNFYFNVKQVFDRDKGSLLLMVEKMAISDNSL
ncbi:hypothetical protein DXB65_12930 [Bacteroides oleiciplenus]|uniref:Uncharacterized protein n=1 Tax=Bacteroides oleiciplenus TaxID=626931 RepID=A0A3E5BAJ8_9BACE|nr:hypothetical protein DXB65_12930 [Bacteroides oleiciplenus]